MRLTSIFLYRVHNIPYRYRGKHRTVKKPTIKDLFTMKWDLVREEQNMLILRHPYLTAEQSYGHMRELKSEQQPFKWNCERDEKFSKQITISHRLNHLKVSEAWD